MRVTFIAALSLAMGCGPTEERRSGPPTPPGNPAGTGDTSTPAGGDANTLPGDSNVPPGADVNTLAGDDNVTVVTNPCPGKPTPSDPCIADFLAVAGCDGNSGGIGKACTPGGGECQLPTLCTVDVQPGVDLWFCTTTCLLGCGDHAQCESDPNDPTQSGCIPSACVQ